MVLYNRAFIQYTKELSSPLYNRLDKDRERTLLEQLSSGSTTALNKLVNAHLRFVVYLLRDFKVPSIVDPMDLVQEGTEGLIYALSKYDASVYNCRVATYAQYYIKWYIAKALGIGGKKDIVDHDLPEDFNLDEICDPDEETYRDEVHCDILHYLERWLDAREIKIISLTYGLEYPFKQKTLREIGLMFHVDAERIRQIKEDALEKIKKKKSEIQILR